ncbi:flagellar hook protein FlgE [bacterium BMS3Bbin12]|nr:flagellar hook protein FlgE [bacterium BMS3Abin12]GBE48696.1 flagellar hook protein FlgE [bacterium BMS3Bbin12]GBE50929.1 flagellar hook protein FlgE [bacterium BMS3Bbin13]HDJ85985.1 flagellar hook protein FlgE [Chromatiales bacterium]HDK03237.1 flagellar hook protein FlgE [Gammaproteobacteria bacterium]
MSFRIALSGLGAATADLNTVSNNIANASTVGFKSSRAEFGDVYAVSAQGIASNAIGSGVRLQKVAQQFKQGNVEFTNKNLDLAINGQGFFALSDNGDLAYTRAGAFSVDKSGYVVDPKGRRLQVFPPGTQPGTFNTGTLSDLQLASTLGAPKATGNVALGLNLPAAATPPATAPFDPADSTTYNRSTAITMYDSLGTAHTATTYYLKTTTPNQWTTYLYIDGNQVTTGGNPSATLQFDSSGRLVSPATGKITYDTDSTTGITPTLDYSSSTQYGSGFAVNSLTQDGFAAGRLSGINIDGTGVVQARFTNGQSQDLGKVALANFANPGGLQQLGNTSWAETFSSGAQLLGEAGTASFGSIQSGALEGSNVNLTKQLVNMIIAQRDFQANAKVITASNAITQTIINIR